MHAFEYSAPASVADAVAALNEDAKLLAGGQTLLPTMKQRLATPATLIDLRKIAGLAGISRAGDSIVIGAMTSHAEVATSSTAGAIKGLAHLASLIGDPAVRHRGTIGGSLANNDPAADYPAAALGLNAVIVTNKREIALEDNEIIVQVKFPIPEKSGYEKFRNPASRYAMVGVFVAKTASGVRVAVTGAGSSGVFRQTEMETALAANFAPDAIKGVEIDPNGLLSDLHGDAEYRAHLVGVIARRAVASAA